MIQILKKITHLLPDIIYLKLRFRWLMGYWPNLDNPTTFSEKLQWLKLYYHRPEFTMMVDKVRVKDYVATILGDDFVIPTLGVWDDPDKIDFNALPERFVLKCNHNSGSGMFICTDKSKMNVAHVKSELRKGLKQNYFYEDREFPYKNVPRRILAEEYIEPANGQTDLLDYKFFCFNGVPKYCQVIGGRKTSMCIDFFDREWNHQPFHEPHNIPFADNEPSKPKNLETMWKAAKKLSAKKPFSRIDFYDLGDKVLFGEITFYPTGGMGGFEPKEYDILFGQMIILPEKEL